MPNLSLKSILLFVIDLPEFLLRSSFIIVRAFFFPKSKKHNKIKSLSQNAGVIESKNKGLRIISIEVMDGFSVYHGIHTKRIKPESLEKIRLGISSKLANKNVFVSQENGDLKTLKVVIQN